MIIIFCSDQRGLQFKPTKVTVDFEQELQEGIRNVWADIEIVGCKFHLTQSWWWKFQAIGLSKKYRDKTSEIGKWLRNIFGMSFLNPEEVGDRFAIDFISKLPQNVKLYTFFDYIF